MSGFSNFAEMMSGVNTVSAIVRMVLAVMIGAAIGFERGKHGRAAGLRTHILVCVGAAISALVGSFMFQTYGNGDPSRIAAGVTSGIGFLGAGIIIVKNQYSVTGLTTAATLWATATAGLAAGSGFYTCALVGGVIIFVTASYLTVFEAKQKRDRRFYIELNDIGITNIVISAIREYYPQAHTFDICAAKSGTVGNVGIAVNVISDSDSSDQITERICSVPGVILAVGE